MDETLLPWMIGERASGGDALVRGPITIGPNCLGAVRSPLFRERCTSGIPEHGSSGERIARERSFSKGGSPPTGGSSMTASRASRSGSLPPRDASRSSTVPPVGAPAAGIPATGTSSPTVRSSSTGVSDPIGGRPRPPMASSLSVPSGALEGSLRWLSTALVILCGVLLLAIPLPTSHLPAGEGDQEVARIAAGVGLLLLVTLRELIHFIRRPRPFSSREV